MVPSSVTFWFYCIIAKLMLGWELHIVHSLSVKLPSTATVPKQNHRIGKDETEQDQDMLLIREAETICRERHDHRALLSLFVPVPEKPIPQPCTTSSSVETTSPVQIYGSRCLPVPPKDFPAGSYLRLGPGGYTKEESFLDGDGIVQCVTIPPDCSRPSDILFSSTYIDTAGRQRERQLQKSIRPMPLNGSYPRYQGSLAKAPRGWPLAFAMIQNMITFRTTQAQKDTCNTALTEHGGRVLALMEQSPPTEIEITKKGEVRTKECMTRLDGAIPSAPLTGGNLGAHGKYDYQSGQQIHVSYDASVEPYVRVDFFEELLQTSKRRGWQRSQTVGVDIPTPVMMHDFAITSNYIVLLDFPLTVRPQRMILDKFPVEYEPENGARIGLLPRGPDGLIDTSQEVKWFDCKVGVVLHTINAYETEDGQNLVLHAFRATPSTEGSYMQKNAPSCLYEWVVDLVNGTLSEQCLNPYTLVEFPTINERKRGKELKYSYGLLDYGFGGPLTEVVSAPHDGFTFNGVAKFTMKDDPGRGLRKGDVFDQFILPRNWYAVSEACLIPKKEISATSGEGVISDQDNNENAYITLLATYIPPDERSFLEIASDETTMKSHFLIIDADNMAAGPISAVELPVSVRYGLHSLFLEWDKHVE